MNFREKMAGTPTIPNTVYENLPAFLKEVVSEFQTPREKDIFFSAVLGVLSGSLNIKGRYRLQEYYANLYVAIAAPAGNGKGVMAFAKYLGQPLHDEFKRNGDGAANKKVLYIPGNVSASMFLQHLADNGGQGIIFESELDTVTNAQKQDWGNTSAELRSAWGHESIQSSRKGSNGQGRQYIEITEPRISVIVSGTFDQIFKFLPSTDNGLFSRFIFYAFFGDSTWDSVQPCTDCKTPKETFLEYGAEIVNMYKWLGEHPKEFMLTEEQWSSLNTHFAVQLSVITVSHGIETDGMVKRMGVNVFRIAMILSALRAFEAKSEEPKLVCSDQDFGTAMALGEVYLQHLIALLEVGPLSKNIAKIKDTHMKFLQTLPQEFETSQALEIAKRDLTIKQRTVERYLNELVTIKLLARTTPTGNYKKVSSSPES